MSAPTGLPFQVGARLGGGAYADVWAVDSKKAVLKLALKQPRSGEGVTGGTFFARGFQFATGSTSAWSPTPTEVLAAELRTLAPLAHPAFLAPIEVGELEGRQWALFPRVDGVTWRESLKTPKGPTLKHVQQLVAALADLQDSGKLLWHGDLKPENLMLTGAGALKVLDPSSGASERDLSGRIAALITTDWYNPAYQASDVFSVGLITVEVLTGKHCLLAAPLERQAVPRDTGLKLVGWLQAAKVTGRASRLLQRITTMPLPRELDAALSPQLEAFALRCMGLARTDKGLDAVEPYLTMREVAQALALLVR